MTAAHRYTYTADLEWHSGDEQTGAIDNVVCTFACDFGDGTLEPDVHSVRIESIDGTPAAQWSGCSYGWQTLEQDLETLVDKFEMDHYDDMVAAANEQAGEDAAEAADRRDEARQERLFSEEN